MFLGVNQMVRVHVLPVLLTKWAIHHYKIQDTRSLLRIFGPHMGHIKTRHIMARTKHNQGTCKNLLHTKFTDRATDFSPGF